jgi:hypothetical protein
MVGSRRAEILAPESHSKAKVEDGVTMHHPQLFALRLWTEQDDPASKDIRFKIQHVLSGEVRYSRSWAEVEAFVMQVFHEVETGVRSEKESAE